MDIIPLKITQIWFFLITYHGRNIAQAVSRRLPTAAARVRSQVRWCGICGGQSETGEGFLRALRFPLLILIPPNAPYSPIIKGWYNRPNSGRHTKWTESNPTPRNNNNTQNYLLPICTRGLESSWWSGDTSENLIQEDRNALWQEIFGNMQMLWW
jgi:hypothetical protein